MASVLFFLHPGRRSASPASHSPVPTPPPTRSSSAVTKTITTFRCGHSTTSFAQSQPNTKSTRRLTLSLPFSRTQSTSTLTLTARDPASCPNCNAQLERDLQNAALIQEQIRANAERASWREGRRDPAPPTRGTDATIQVLANGEDKMCVWALQNLRNSSAGLESGGRYREMEEQEMKIRGGAALNPWEAQRIMWIRAQEQLDAVFVPAREAKKEEHKMQGREEVVARQEQGDLTHLKTFIGSSPSLGGVSPTPSIEAKLPSCVGTSLGDQEAEVSDHSTDFEHYEQLIDGQDDAVLISQPLFQTSSHYSSPVPEEVAVDSTNKSLPSSKDGSGGEVATTQFPSRPSISPSSPPANFLSMIDSLVDTFQELDELFADETEGETCTVSHSRSSSISSLSSSGSIPHSPVSPLSEEGEQLTSAVYPPVPITTLALQSQEPSTSLIPLPLTIRPASPLALHFEQQEQADITSSDQEQEQEPSDASAFESRFSPPSGSSNSQALPPPPEAGALPPANLQGEEEKENTWTEAYDKLASFPQPPAPLYIQAPPSSPAPTLSLPAPPPPALSSSLPPRPQRPPPPSKTSLLLPAGITALRTIYAYFSLPMTVPPTQLISFVEFKPWIRFPRSMERGSKIGGLSRSEVDVQRMCEIADLYLSIDWESAAELERLVGLRDAGKETKEEVENEEQSLGEEGKGGIKNEGKEGGRDVDPEYEEDRRFWRYKTIKPSSISASSSCFPWTTVPISALGKQRNGLKPELEDDSKALRGTRSLTEKGSKDDGEGEGEEKEEEKGEEKGEGEETEEILSGEKGGGESGGGLTPIRVDLSLSLTAEQKAELMLGLGISL